MRMLRRSDCTILPLVLKGRWYDMIASGEKKEEYRECKDHWTKRIGRLIDKGPLGGHKGVVPILGFSRGYRKPDLFFVAEGECIRGGVALHPEWGEPECEHYVLKLGEQVEITN